MPDVCHCDTKNRFLASTPTRGAFTRDDEVEKFFSFSGEEELGGVLWSFLEFLKDKSQPYAKTIDNRIEPVAERAQDYKRTARSLPAYLVATSSIPFLVHRIPAPETLDQRGYSKLHQISGGPLFVRILPIPPSAHIVEKALVDLGYFRRLRIRFRVGYQPNEKRERAPRDPFLLPHEPTSTSRTFLSIAPK